MKYAVLAARLLLGLVFAVLGSNYFLNFMTMSGPEPTPAAKSFITALMSTNYMTVIKVIEVTGGILLLSGILVPLGLVLLTPVIVNIALYDTQLMSQPGLGLIMLPVAVFLIWAYFPYFKSVFTIFARPAVCAQSK